MIAAGSLTPAECRAARAVRCALSASNMLYAVARLLDTIDEVDIARDGSRYAAPVSGHGAGSTARCAETLAAVARVIAATETTP